MFYRSKDWISQMDVSETAKFLTRLKGDRFKRAVERMLTRTPKPRGKRGN